LCTKLSLEKPSPKKKLLQKTVVQNNDLPNGISLMAVCIIGASVLVNILHSNGNAWLQMPWMHVNLALFCAVFVPRQMPPKAITRNIISYSQLHANGMWGQLLYFLIVFLVVLKNAVNWIYGVVGILFSTLIMLGRSTLQKIRKPIVIMLKGFKLSMFPYEYEFFFR
jgi:putative membrane protein